MPMMVGSQQSAANITDRIRSAEKPSASHSPRNGDWDIGGT